MISMEYITYKELLELEENQVVEQETVIKPEKKEKMQKHQVHNLIILDESGSMESIKGTIIQGFNELVQTIKGIEKKFPEQEHFISMISFNSFGNKILHFADAIEKLEQIDQSKYSPDAMTPLYDAMGFSINKLRRMLKNAQDYNVLVTIVTDGMENHSKEYSRESIKILIEELKNKQWAFTYIGADHNVENTAFSLAIDNTMRFEKNEHDMRIMFEKEKSAREKYSSKIRNKEDTDKNFYE